MTIEPLLRSLKRRTYKILITDNKLVDSLIPVAATVPEWIFVLDLHCEPRRVCIGLTFDLGQRPPLPNDFLFSIILGDPRHWKLQFLRAPIFGKIITAGVTIWLEMSVNCPPDYYSIFYV
jgi:hypothetical protein